MARCSDCGHEMNAVTGCDAAEKFTDFSDGIDRPRIPYGSEKGFSGPRNRVCHDCLAAVGKFHHSGCDVEECPKCHKQAISCLCTDEVKGV